MHIFNFQTITEQNQPCSFSLRVRAHFSSILSLYLSLSEVRNRTHSSRTLRKTRSTPNILQETRHRLNPDLLNAMADQAKSETQNDDPLAESTDILAAAHKLMQLNNNNNDDDVRGKRKRISGEEVDQIPNDNTTSAKINEIFGNDIEVIARPKKRKKYRSLASIYRVTTPINTEKGKKVRA